jgi:hypothetical protein
MRGAGNGAGMWPLEIRISNLQNYKDKSPGMFLHARGVAKIDDQRLLTLQASSAEGLFQKALHFRTLASVQEFGHGHRVRLPCAKTLCALGRGDSLNRICVQRS